MPLARFHFIFSRDGNDLPKYPGSAWRGAFGQALKKTVCIVRNTPCAACLLKTSCTYAYLFETSPPQKTEQTRQYKNAPHPFVFKFSEEQTAADYYYFDMILFGHGLRYLPYIIHALNQAGLHGIDGKRQIFMLQQMEQHYWQAATEVIYSGGNLQN